MFVRFTEPTEQPIDASLPSTLDAGDQATLEGEVISDQSIETITIKKQNLQI